jgi:hypothetical protein
MEWRTNGRFPSLKALREIIALPSVVIGPVKWPKTTKRDKPSALLADTYAGKATPEQAKKAFEAAAKEAKASQKVQGTFQRFRGLFHQWKEPMYSVSMTTRLGLATVLGAIAVVILAHSKDHAPITNRCKGENCTITAIDEVMRNKVPKSA